MKFRLLKVPAGYSEFALKRVPSRNEVPLERLSAPGDWALRRHPRLNLLRRYVQNLHPPLPNIALTKNNR
jgi:hypothetical protein